MTPSIVDGERGAVLCSRGSAVYFVCVSPTLFLAKGRRAKY